MSPFNLTVAVDADIWNYTQRRVTYLEAVLVRMGRDNGMLRGWFTAAELALYQLPGLPGTYEAMTRRANNEGWLKRKTRWKGRYLNVYSVTSLPPVAFDALVASILDLPTIHDTAPLVGVLPEPPPMPVTAHTETNTAPAWVLPLMRIMKTETAGDLAEAWVRLPERLPPEIALPTVEEAATILVQFGIAGRS